ncbi:NAD-dependent epimerase/dehydratase family protein [Rhodopseudomonas palustris]|uniref:NAD-dependent epimerase/dehydratase family protein n=1 Tax=Rhodopseudomonas palustris TaxID=1076 RepID=UPI0020CEAD8D|nr:NAD-dependent epimerase/dehydratase family protein [Rhodopseudomonas palustris]MCP9626172.1 NAD-dependent epimerase/dehydratase family protein [Rhodopseudomonas palustris]
MVRVLVSGGAGFLGSHLVDRLLQREAVSALTVVDNFWTGRPGNLAHVRDGRLRLVEAAVEHFSSAGRFDEIYHLASPASPPWYMAEPLRTISANVMGAARLLECLEPGGQIAFTSTSEVYGDPLVSPQPETYRGSVDCTGPRSSYDESKRCVEAMLFAAHRTQHTRVKVARLFNVYGPRTRPDDGRAMSNFITQALRGLPLTVHGDGSHSRSWGYVDDIMDALELYFWKAGLDYPGPLNIGNDREVAVLEVARHVARLVPGSRIIHTPPVPQDPTNRRPDLSLIRKLLPGWACRVHYEEGAARVLSWFENEFESVAAGS